MFKHTFYLVFLILTSVLLLTSCGNEKNIGPLAIDEEIDVCETCYMLVSENQFAAQIVTSNGDVFKFDDIGCMVSYINDHQSDGQLYTKDYYTNEWINVNESFFVETMDVETPMNSGYISFGNRPNLEKYLEQANGEEVIWSDLLIKMKERDGDEEHKLSHN